MTDIILQPTDRAEPREKSSKPVSRNRQRGCVYTCAYATWPRALVCGYLPVCVPVRHGAPFLRSHWNGGGHHGTSEILAHDMTIAVLTPTAKPAVMLTHSLLMGTFHSGWGRLLSAPNLSPSPTRDWPAFLTSTAPSSFAPATLRLQLENTLGQNTRTK